MTQQIDNVFLVSMGTDQQIHSLVTNKQCMRLDTINTPSIHFVCKYNWA